MIVQSRQLNYIHCRGVFILWELIRNNEEIFIILYCIIILWINLDYLKDYNQLRKSLSGLSSDDDDELIINPDSIVIMLFVLIFNFFRRWLFYILAVFITQNILVMIVSVVLFVIGLYSSLFHNSLTKVKQSSRIQFYLAVIDTLFISIFMIYLLVS